VLEVDNIVVCAGQMEQRGEKVADVGRLRVYTIGGAYSAGELTPSQLSIWVCDWR
jgi:hypothetical protein